MTSATGPYPSTRRTIRAPSAGWRLTSSHWSSVRRCSASRIESGNANLPMSCKRPDVCTRSSSSAGRPIATAVACAYRATAAEWRAVIRSRSASVSIIAVSTPICSAASRSARFCEHQQLAQQVLERDEHHDQEHQRREAAAGVDERDEHAQQRADQLRRQHRHEDRPELVRERPAAVEHVVAGDAEEVDQDRDEEAAEDQQREAEVVLLQVERARPRPGSAGRRRAGTSPTWRGS